jgi:dienelactone hydrolase
MGVVYLAHDTELDRPVALKSLPAGLMSDPRALSRFQREARILASLNHPNVATIHEKIEQTEGSHYLVLEYIPGQTLTEKMRVGQLSLGESLRISLQIVEALSAAHSKGIMHRDLNPKNIKITPEGNVKVLDFGIAKTYGERARPREYETGQVGRAIGTPPYMSPEQVLGGTIDHRTDIWSFGCLLYEMLAGVRSFSGDVASDVFSSVMKVDPDLKKLPAEVKPALRGIISRCLAKDPEQRYQSADELRADLEHYISALTVPAPSIRTLLRFAKRPNVAVPIGLVMLVACITTLWLFVRSAKTRWAREEALPEIARLIPRDNYYAAFVLARKAEKYIPNDPVLKDLWPRMSRECLITTTPAGAQVFLSEYSATDTAWDYLGRSPLESIRVPFGAYRWRIEKEGFGTVESVRFKSPSTQWGAPDVVPLGKIHFTLHEEGSLAAGMVWIPPSELGIKFLFHRRDKITEAPAYLIDRYEVTNEDFKEFVDAGGYRDPEHWRRVRFVEAGRQISWEQAMTQFRDATGRPGPSTWEGGGFPEGRGDYPVSGVSWFEAAAYAQFKGKSLPTVFHWIKACRADDDPSRITHMSNFGDGSAPVGSHRGTGQFGLYDAAGNVREWCHNAIDDAERPRCILGGAWGEAPYMFVYGVVRSPWDRDPGNGFRCVQYLGGKEAVPERAFRAIKPIFRDFDHFTPISDETYKHYIDNLYRYDRTRLQAALEWTDENPAHYRRERITFDAAYSNDRVIAYLYLPKGITPPYQTVVWFPGGGARDGPPSENFPYSPEREFIIKSGRALLFPVYKGTYERSGDIQRIRPEGKNTVFFRDIVVQMSKDLRRSIDYLETREDIDTNKLAYVGLSWGGILGPIMMTTENRFKTGIFLKGGICACERHQAIDPANFAPRVKVPVLMLSGEHDSILPLETAQKPLFNLLGSSEKRHITYPGGHGLAWEYRKDYEQDIRDWLDHYLGPVKYEP